MLFFRKKRVLHCITKLSVCTVRNPLPYAVEKGGISHPHQVRLGHSGRRSSGDIVIV